MKFLYIFVSPLQILAQPMKNRYFLLKSFWFQISSSVIGFEFPFCVRKTASRIQKRRMVNVLSS